MTTRVVNANLQAMSRSPKSSRTASIGRAELEILNFICDHHPATVRQVADHLAQSRGLVRTTALNVISRLCRKGFLARKKTGGIYFYSPKIPQKKLLRDLVGDFIHQMLGGSLDPFVAYLADAARLTDQQIADLRKMAHQLQERKEHP